MARTEVREPGRPFGIRVILASVAGLALVGCATVDAGTATAGSPPAAAPVEPFASTYVRPISSPTLIRNATVIDGAGGEFANADVLLVDGRVAGVGPNLTAPQAATVIDATGRFVTAGIIDIHSHLGVYPSPSIDATSDGNEATSLNTAQVWAEHSVWPMDPGFERAVAGGITALHVLPGSANLFGGRGVTLRPVLGARTYQEMKFPNAPQSLKMACGENPSRVYGSRNQSPATDMGNVAGWRAAWIEAQAYQRTWNDYRTALADLEEGAEPPDPPTRDLQMETMVGVLEGDILVQWHCYRSDEMVTAMGVAEEFGFHIAAFHHGVETYKIADILAEANICTALWADWWGFKLEAYDGIRENIAFNDAAGGCPIVHSDSEVGIQRLNQEAAKAVADGRRAGLEISRAHAWRWLSLNPATALGIGDETGSLEVGKAGDVVIWSADPFSVYAVAQQVFMDGAMVYDRAHRGDPASDFELGQDYREPAQ
ncbi:MAG: amidohydrolase family protein [Caulobacterales bacterium]